MQNDLQISLNQTSNIQTLMVIGQQGVGKSLLIQKFQGMNVKAIQESKISDLNIELVDTPSYDSYFTLLPIRDPKVTGYIIMFSDQNNEVFRSIKQIRRKLLTINGLHKRTIIVHNDFSTYNNTSTEINFELFDIRQWCKQQDLLLISMDIKNASAKDIINIFERMFMKKIEATLLQKIFMWMQYIIAFYTFLFAIWLSIHDPSLIISNISLELYLLTLLCLGIGYCFIPYYGIDLIYSSEKRNQSQRQYMHIQSKQHLVTKSKIVSGVVTIISAIALLIATIRFLLVSCFIMAILFAVNSSFCLYVTISQANI